MTRIAGFTMLTPIEEYSIEQFAQRVSVLIVSAWRENGMSFFSDGYSGQQVHNDEFSGSLPAGWRIEISRIAPGFGHDGGGLQVQVLNVKDKVMTIEDLLDPGINVLIDVDEVTP